MKTIIGIDYIRFLRGHFYVTEDNVTAIDLRCPVKYSEVCDLSRSATDRFGTDPEKFRVFLDDFKTRKYRIIKEYIMGDGRIYYDSSYYGSLVYESILSVYLAILQINMEVPGFIYSFPEVIEFRRIMRRNGEYAWKQDITRGIERYVTGLNRYSGHHDLKCLQKRAGIKDEDLGERYEKVRVDDYVSYVLPDLLQVHKTGKFHDYLVKYYVWPDTLLPDDYKKMVLSLCPDEIEDETEIDWIDNWFAREEEYLAELKPGEHGPDIMRRINKVRIG